MSKPVVLLDAGELVALPGASDGDVLTWNGTTNAWQSSPGGGVGTVTSVALDTGSTGLTVSGGTSQTITGSGTFAIAGTLGAGYGGTGLVAPVVGDSGKVLTATSSGGYVLSTPAAQGITSITAGAGLTGGTITSTGTIAMPNVGTAGTYGTAASVPVIVTDDQGRVSSVVDTGIVIAIGAVTGLDSALAGKVATTTQVLAGTGLSGGGALSGDVTLSLPSVGTASSYGSASSVPVFVTDAQGRVTAVTPTPIGSLPASVITSGTIGLNHGGTGIDASGVTSGQILVGNGSGGLGLVSVSGDGSLTSLGALSVQKIYGNPVSSTVLGLPDAGKALVWSGTEWQASQIQGGGGGGGLTFYMNYAASSPYPLSTAFDENAGWDTGSITVANDANGTALGTFVTAVDVPSIEVIPAGIWEVNFYAQASANANSTAVRFKVAKLAGVTQTVIATSDWVYIYDPAVVTGYSASVYVPLTDLELTDRVEIIFEGRRFVSSSQTVRLHFGTDSITHAHTTINAPGGTGLLKVVNGYLQSPATLLENADVAADAAIEVAKLANGTSGQIVVAGATVPAYQTMSGDATIDSSGALTLSNTAVSANTYGTTAAKTVSFTVDSKGRLTAASEQDIAIAQSQVSGLTTDLGNKVPTSRQVIAGTGLDGGGALSSDVTLSLPNVGTSGTYGSASAVPVIVTDAQGRVTSVTNTSISITASQVTDLATSAVTSVAGTTDQVNVSGATGAVTLSLPQSIASTSSPTFAGIKGSVSSGTILRLDPLSGSALTLEPTSVASGSGTALSLKAGQTTDGNANGGSLALQGGVGGAAAAGGSVNIDAGTGSTAGSINIGTSVAASVKLAKAGVTTQVQGGLTLSGITGQATAGFLRNAVGGGVSGGNAVSLGSSDVSGTLLATNGGTAQSTYTTGDVLYASATNTLAKRAIGTSNQVLTVSGGVPTWVAVPYDLSGEVVGAVTVGTVVFRWLSPRDITLESLSQSTGGSFATVKIQVGGVDASYPQNVASGALVTAVVTVAGTDSYFTVKGKVA